MDLPEEDKTALAKRRAIQAVMRNKNLSPAQRHKEMQEIMKGNFTVDDDSFDSDASDSDSDSDSEGSYSERSEGSYSGSSVSEEGYGGGGTRGRDDRSRSDDDDDDDDGSDSESESSSGYESGSVEGTRSDAGSIDVDSLSRGSSGYSTSSSRADGSQPSRGSGRSGGEKHRNGGGGGSGGGGQGGSMGRRGSGISTSSAASSASQKDKQKALLEISRDKTLSPKERQARMKEIMQTRVTRQGLNEREPSWKNRRRPSRRESEPRDSVREPPDNDREDRKTMRLSRRRIMGNVTQISDMVTQVRGNDANLMRIELQKMNLTDEDVIPLLDALGRNRTVLALDLRRNRIGIEGCSTLASAILDNKTLESVDVSGNSLGDEGVEDLSKVIPYNKTLETLNLEDNKVGDAGVAALAESLTQNSTLKEINLSGNLIGDAGATTLFNVLSSANASVSSLLLRFNAISDKGATELASALLDNEALNVVDLGNNQITNVGAKDLLKVVSINDTLETLELGGNVGINEDMLEEIQRALEEEGDSDDDDSGTESGSEEGSEYSEMEASANTESVGMGDDGGDDNGDNDAGDAAPTGGEAMLEDMPDENNAALAKRKAIQSVMRDQSLSAVERNKKIQDIMAGRVKLPKVEPKKPPRTKPTAVATGHAGRGEEGREGSGGGSGRSARVVEPPRDAAVPPSNDSGARPTGGEAMLEDMPDEDNAALAKRRAIQSVMRDQSLSSVERNRKMQDIMAGRLDLSKFAPPPKVERPTEAGGGSGRPSRRTRREEEEESESEESGSESELGRSSSSEEGVPDSTSALSGDGDQPTGGEAMLQDMPDENNTALAKRKAIQSVMGDRSLSSVERNKKIQDIMAGRVKLPKVEPKEQQPPPSAAARPPADRGRRRRTQEASNSDSEGSEESSSDGSSYSEGDDSDSRRAGSSTSSVENKDSNVAVKAKAPAADAAADGEGANAMLRDMADESDNTLAKRRAVQEAMRDRSLSSVERNKKIQDIMAGRVKLPPPPPKASSPPPPPPSKATRSKRQGLNKKEAAAPRAASPPPPPKATQRSRDERSKQKKEAMVATNNNATVPSRRGQERKPSTQQQTKDAKKGNVATGLPPKRQPKGGAKVANKKPQQKVLQRRLSQEGSNGLSRPSNDGGTRANIANEWKRRMMAVHPRSHDNLLDILLAHQYRLSLEFPPRQSFFRVVAVVFFARVVDGVRRSERYHVVGTNDEPHSIGGSICAERAALMQLRFIPDLDEITKVVIVTDDADAITPGMLCREFMASHDRVPWDVPIVLGRSVCRKCGLTVSGKACGDADGRFDEAKSGALRDANADLWETCAKGHDGTKNGGYPTPHDFVGTITTLKDLFPYPSLYARMTSTEAKSFGEKHLSDSVAALSAKNKGKGNEGKSRAAACLARQPRRFSDDQSVTSYRQEKFDLTMLTDIMEEDEEGGQSVATVDEKSQCTMGESSTVLGRRQVSSPSPVKSSMSQSLKTTISFMKHLREDGRPGLGVNGQQGRGDPLSSDLSVASLEHLTARTLRISNRLKPSQRREKLLRLATEVTALEGYANRGVAANAHPIRYGAAVLFSDNTVAIAAQKVAIEYGCTLDAVGQLASVVDRKAIQLEEDVPPCRPVLLAQCDQFGIAHAPFAQGRAFLTERGYGDCRVLVHQQRQAVGGDAREEGTAGGEGERRARGRGPGGGDDIDLRLLEVEANDLAPAPPDIFGGMITKNHSSQGGLQIQF